jgi:glycosyltransferase involved in cell wall biosynthesis
MADPLRIGINALYLIPGGVGGTEIYLRNLIAALAKIDSVNQYFVFTNRETGADLVPRQPNFIWTPQKVRARFRPARIYWEQAHLPRLAKQLHLSVMFNPGFTSPIWSPCPNVTVFHDLQHKRHPKYFRWFDLPFWLLLLKASALRSRGLISVSQATADDLKKFYGVDSVVIHHGVEAQFFQVGRERDPKHYILCVSTLHPHKNLEGLIRAYGDDRELPFLVITGLRGFSAEHLEKLAGRQVRFTGWVSRDELYNLFRGARAFVYPSRFEGFGMPVLEAMAARVPVACSDIPPLREIADGCAIFFDPTNLKQMRQAILRSLEDDSLVDAALQRASQFTWENAALATLDYLRRSSN